MQVLSYQSDVLSHKQQSKRLQEDNQRLQNQMLATGERLEKMTHDNSLDLKKEMLKLQRQLAGNCPSTCACVVILMYGFVFQVRGDGPPSQGVANDVVCLWAKGAHATLLQHRNKSNLVSYACASCISNLM